MPTADAGSANGTSSSAIGAANGTSEKSANGTVASTRDSAGAVAGVLMRNDPVSGGAGTGGGAAVDFRGGGVMGAGGGAGAGHSPPAGRGRQGGGGRRPRGGGVHLHVGGRGPRRGRADAEEVERRVERLGRGWLLHGRRRRGRRPEEVEHRVSVGRYRRWDPLG